MPNWSAEDEKNIINNYQNMNYLEIQRKFFPDRTPSQVESKITRMRITKRKAATNG